MRPSDPPVRLCCGKRHYGATCADNHVMCQLCFGRFPLPALHHIDGIPEDVCQGCFERDAEALARVALDRFKTTGRFGAGPEAP